MSILPSLFGTYPSLYFPASVLSWVGWLWLLSVLVWLVYRGRSSNASWNSRAWGLFIALFLIVILAPLIPGINFPAGAPLPDTPQESYGPAMILFWALPWMLAGGILGPVAAVVLGVSAGLIRFFWDTHSIFSPLEMALLGVLFSLAVRQRYRTLLFRLLREPFIAATALAILYVPLYVIDAFLLASGSIAIRLDYALSNVNYAALAIAGELLIGGLFAQVLAVAFPRAWGRHQPEQPSPSERSLQSRFLFGTGTLVVLMLVALLIGDWTVAGQAARQMLHDRMQGTAELASQNVPFFLETGQNLSSQIALDPLLSTQTGQALDQELGRQMRALPFFDQLILFDHDKNVLGSYPTASPTDLVLFPEESNGFDLAFKGVLRQVYTIPQAASNQPARISFIAAVVDPQSGQPSRLLLGRTNLQTNPFTQPLLNTLGNMNRLDGTGILLDENGRILYQPNLLQIMDEYPGQLTSQPSFFDDTAANGTRNLVYDQPVSGRSWSVIITVPARQAQQLALTIAAPLFFMILGLALIALLSLRVGLQSVTGSLQNLANEAMRIAQGQLDHPLSVQGVDELGQLRRAFEQMRASLQARLEELNRLLLVSQGVASSLEMRDAVQPVLEAVLAGGASAVRLVMTSIDEEEENHPPDTFGLGPQAEPYAYLDGQLSKLTQQQERIVITNVSRARGLDIPVDKPFPASLFAIALRHENQNYGILWIGYDPARTFSDTDIRFLTTLAGQAALAASNNHLFRSAEVGRQRLAAILASTPDPVLVTDQSNRLLLANPAATQLFSFSMADGGGQPIKNVISQKPLVDILQGSSNDPLSAEVSTPNGQVYLATASPVMADDHPVGRVCILRDVTRFKEVDTMKTEFVNTVSHDLRSPLTLMRGYATMLEMVGSLNEQQQGYVQKIITGVENMSKLVNNLLDLGRIDVGVGLQLETIPITDIIDRVTGALQLQASQKEIHLDVELPKNTMPLIEADQALLQQAMYNLVENAIKYTPRNGGVTARLKIIEDMMQFEVQDTGIGVAPADQPRLFEKFYRAGQREAREQKGTGLGLAIVKSIAERHGGRVWLESELGKGSTFFLQVPLHQPKGAHT